MTTTESSSKSATFVLLKDPTAPQQTPIQFSLREVKAAKRVCYKIDKKSVESQFKLKEAWFEEEGGQLGSVITNDVLKPGATYLVHGEKILSAQPTSTNQQQQSRSAHALRKTGLIFDDAMMKHSGNAGHPEKPARLSFICSELDDMSCRKLCIDIPARAAKEEDVLTTHTQDYVAAIKKTTAEDVKNNALPFPHTSDVYFGDHSAQAAFMAAGCAITLTEKVIQGEVDNGFAIIRPPGHHASADKAMGFCLFNNVAVAANVAIKKHKLRRVMILDWDVHHGNGTYEIVKDNEHILFVSIHRTFGNFYPGTGHAEQVGVGNAVGRTVNIPFFTGPYGDADMLFVFHQIIMPVATEFQPELVLVSAGFDAVFGDPLGGVHLSPQVYGHLTALLSSLAGGNLVLCLEGGYNLQLTATCVVECVKVLMGRLPSPLPEKIMNEKKQEMVNPRTPHPDNIPVFRQVIAEQSKYWKCMEFLRSLAVSLVHPLQPSSAKSQASTLEEEEDSDVEVAVFFE